MIPQSFIDDVQNRADIVDVIGSYIPLKKAGRNFKALCPFHGEKTPSFVISPQKQIFHCFGCGQGGGAIQFIMFHEKVSFPEAVEILAQRLGLAVPHKDVQVQGKKNQLFDALAIATDFFQKSLRSHNHGKLALDYLVKRGMNEDIIKQFRVGYAIGSNTLLDHLRSKGFSLQVLEKASLITGSSQGYRDLFFDRIMFPIFDVRGRTVAFGGRLRENKPSAPKYINSLENPVYSKRDILFGLNFSKEAILKQDEVLVVEGYLDMIMPFSCGIKNIVASSGTALTQEQTNLIKRYASNVVLLYDADSAGQTAALRALDLLLENGLNVKIVRLPQGFDPDSLVREKGSKQFLKLLEEREDFFDYKLNSLRRIHNFDNAQGKAAIADHMLSTLIKLNSEVERCEYAKKLADELRVKPQAVEAELDKALKKAQKTSRFNVNSALSSGQDLAKLAQSEPLSVTEKVLLKCMLTNPAAFKLVKDNARLNDFSTISQKAVAYFYSNYNPEQDLVSFVRAIGDNQVSGFVSRILMDETIPLDKEAFKSSLIKIRKRKFQELKNQLKDQIKDAEERKDKEHLKVLITKYGKMKESQDI